MGAMGRTIPRMEQQTADDPSPATHDAAQIVAGLDRESAGRHRGRAPGGEGRRPGRAQVARVLDRHAPGDAALREALIRRGLARAGQFPWRRTAERTLAVYDELADSL